MTGLRFRSNIRVKLILSLLAVVFITGITSIIIGIKIINSNIIGQAYDAVENNLKTARYIYDEKIIFKKRFFNYIASKPTVVRDVMARDRKSLANRLNEMRQSFDIDILNIADAKGRIIIRSSNPKNFGDSVGNDMFVKHVIFHKEGVSGYDVVSGRYLCKESTVLAERARVNIIPTERSRKRHDSVEERGMMLKAASPLFYQGKFIGVLYGGILLNNNHKLINKFKSTVFNDRQIDGYDVGTATIFLGDVRISTNVKRRDGTSAVGTLVSEEVYRRVFEEGKLWLDKAFVVNKWYLSAYGPIKDIKEKIIGIMYVGILEDKFSPLLRSTTIYFLLMIFLTGVIAVLLSVYLINLVITPVKIFIEASKEIARGNYREIPVVRNDEIGYLCRVFNNMVEAILEKDSRLKESMEKQLAQSEKLASLGRLASGIAHEINNPLTGVLTYSSMLLEDLRGTKYQDDLLIIRNETLRCRGIVKGILDFARETKLEREITNLNTVINDTFVILEKHVNFQNIIIRKDLNHGIPDIFIDVNQIKSVVNNLAVNAADAMAEGGELYISTNLSKDGLYVLMKVKDSGIGISEENLSRIYDPFFTTKETGKGTGLGLAVTYGIIQRHNGFINVHSTPGKGTEIEIGLPVQNGPFEGSDQKGAYNG